MGPYHAEIIASGRVGVILHFFSLAYYLVPLLRCVLSEMSEMFVLRVQVSDIYCFSLKVSEFNKVQCSLRSHFSFSTYDICHQKLNVVHFKRLSFSFMCVQSEGCRVISHTYF